MGLTRRHPHLVDNLLMDQFTRMPIHIFNRIEMGTDWDDCWIWWGGLTSGRSAVAWINGEQVHSLRNYIREIFHPGEPRRRVRPSCHLRCVHPDHSWRLSSRNDVVGGHAVGGLRRVG